MRWTLCVVVAASALHARTTVAQRSRVPTLPADSVVVRKILAEAIERSQVMDHAFVLTDVHGPRLTGTPGFRAAGEWAVQRLRSFGLAEVRAEAIPWGRGWSASSLSVRMLEPGPTVLLGAPGPWSGSTAGELQGAPVLAPAATEVTRQTFEDYARRFRGTLGGKFVLLDPPRAIALPTAPPARRLSDEELARMASTSPAPASPRFPDSVLTQFRTWGLRLNQFWFDEGVLALVHRSRGDGGMVVATGPDWAHDTDVRLPPTVFLAAEHYERIVRLLQQRQPVQLAMAAATRQYHDPAAAFNVVADIRGSTLPDEIVMIGAHLDSWSAGTGATDDAAGCAIAIEAMRVLVSLGVRPARTIRLALWGGHEGGGHLGSRTYVEKHFRNAAAPSSTRAQLTLYFNLDNGGGKIRGLNLPQRYAADRARIASWFAPVSGLGAATIGLIAEPRGSDHESFFDAGLPSAMFIQDPLDYASRTRHSNMDVYDRLQPDDLRQASAVVAAVLYQAAMYATPRSSPDRSTSSPRR